MKNWILMSKEVPSESKIYNITYKSTSGRRRSDSAFTILRERSGTGMKRKKKK